MVSGAAAVTATGDLSELLAATAETAREITGAKYAAIGVIGEHGTLVEFIHSGIPEELAEAIGPLPTGRGVLGTLIIEAKTIRLDRIQDHPDSSGFPPNHPPMTAFLGVPVRAGNRVFGNLYLTEKAGGFTDDDEQIVEAFAAIAGSAVASVRLQDKLRRLAVVETGSESLAISTSHHSGSLCGRSHNPGTGRTDRRRARPPPHGGGGRASGLRHY